MEEITRLIREAIGHTRDLARGLSPVLLQSKGLAVALQDLAESTTRHMRGVRCRCETGVPEPVPPDDAAIHLYRIAQEAVANAVKHGRATEIVIVLRLTGDRLVLAIEDNGRGFQEGAAGGTGMGLRVMHYRAGIIGGSLEIVRGPGSGVTVTCTVGALPRGPVSLTE